MKSQDAPVISENNIPINQTPKTNVPEIYFPDSIRTVDFALRKLTIGIYEAKPLGKTYDDVINKLKQASDELSNYSFESTIEVITKKMNGEIVKNITLPVPNELNDATNHAWGTKTGIAQAISDKVGVMGTLQEEIGSRAADMLGMNKVLVNPGYFQNYTGSEPRRFAFTFQLVPNNKLEANRIIEIITTLKKYASPTKTFGLLLTAPHFFSLTFGNPVINKLINVRPCVISSIDVNYSGSGFMETTMDGMPKVIMLSITFQETSATTFEDWEVSK